MPSMLISNMEAAVAGPGTHDVIPAAGQAYLVREIGSNQTLAAADAPDVSISIADGVLANAIVRADPANDPGRRIRPLELYITPDNYLTIGNTAAAPGNLSWYGERVDPNTVITDILAIVAPATTAEIRPPAGEVWRITEIGCDVWTVPAADINPNLIVGVTDGTLVASMIIQPTMVRGQDKPLDLIIDHDVYLLVTDVGGAGCVVGFSGVIVPLTSIGSIQDVGIGGTLDIIPPATQEWVVTEIAAELWLGGGAPNDYPDILVSMRVAANLSTILEGGSVDTTRAWNNKLHLHIDNTHYLRITNLNAAANEVGVLGYLRRSYS